MMYEPRIKLDILEDPSFRKPGQKDSRISFSTLRLLLLLGVASSRSMTEQLGGEANNRGKYLNSVLGDGARHQLTDHQLMDQITYKTPPASSLPTFTWSKAICHANLRTSWSDGTDWGRDTVYPLSESRCNDSRIRPLPAEVNQEQSLDRDAI
jgi:hypothetical protein